MRTTSEHAGSSKPATGRLVAAVLALSLSPPVLAWGVEGHRLVAELAQQQLTPAAAAEVDRLLLAEPGATLVSVSTWADEQRSRGTAPLHYVNLPEGDCQYSRSRDCPDGRCVVEGINAQIAVLKSTAPDARRLEALKWVVHLVADLHQPLHVGLAADKGGNLYQVRAFGRGSNLHAIWDTELIRRRSGGLRGLLGVLATPTVDASPGDPARWANESCEIRRSAGFYPDDRAVGDPYAERWEATLASRLGKAGRRLADLLNGALAPRSRVAPTVDRN